MADSRKRRRLAAILMADVAGFSRLMGKDEEGTTSRILAFHDDVKAAVEKHGGRVVATAGDSVFGDFDSIVEALACAEEIQKSLHTTNAELGDDERIEARIGLHLGDVIIEEYNVFGDGVNIAARLEQLAEPGGIVISEAVYQQVKSRSSLPFEDMGTRSLKNIDQPIKLYRVPPQAFSADYVPSSEPETALRSDKDSLRETIREAIEGVAAEVREAVRESRDAGLMAKPPEPEEPPEPKKRVKVDAPFGPGTFVLLAIGILLVLARTTGWSDNDLYPFFGCWILGVGVGRLLGRLTHRRGLATVFNAIGVAVGTFFFSNTVMKAILWVLAAAGLGAGAKTLVTGPGEDDLR